MSRMMLTLLLVAVFVVVSLFWENHVCDHTQTLIDTVEQAIQALDQNGDFAKSGQWMREFEEKWQHVHDTWETMIAHAKLMDIETAFMQAQSAIGDEDKAEAMMQLVALKVALEHLADSHALSLENLL